MAEKQNWDIPIHDIGHTYEGLHWNWGVYVGKGRRHSDFVKEPYRRERVKVI